ncbi:alpha/beta fold hydrolase [Nocardioides sp. LS1]|uniref:alpha/beta fold hydrolase n=1 Tax=Nocardioides sp. LS1 TaxID=1027620 RepID=UPI000F628194|nr:alpha/beta hydrolase [Nocardioides sp. LS1]GCD89698.1 alpha/beta hydrolase [Nocardioides sp. LS1]
MSILHHRDEGSGPVVVLIHAGVADLRMWQTQVEELVPGHRVVRPDLRGYGHTPLEPGDPYTDAEDVLALLDHLGVEDFALVGASYGAYVALQLATAVPERVERLVLLAPLAEVAEPDDRLRDFWRREGELVEAGDLDAATDLNVATFVGPDAAEDARELVWKMQRGIFEHQGTPDHAEGGELPVDLARLAMHTTVVVGAHDLPFFVQTAHELVRALPDAELVELPWAGHLPSLERPLETAHLVRIGVG